ncbi:MAG: MbnP family protein [Pedobacter sp.]
MKKILTIIIITSILFTACKKDNTTPDFDEQNLASLSVEFDNIVGGRTFTLNNTAVPYTNAAGEKFTISMVQYFISNIQVTTTAGKQYTVPQDSSYFLIKGADRASRFAKIRVPEGDYSKLTFVLGVDSLRSTMPVDKRTGVLDPAMGGGGHGGGGMYWGWNSGYIFFKLEGNSEVISDDQQGDPTGNKKFRYHIGGFGGYSAPTINNIKTITVDLNSAGIAKVRRDRQSNIHLFVDLMKFFNGTNSFSIKAHPTIMFSEYSTNISKNLTELFTHDHTEN